ncbi:SDR family NAD(P)-dependent oxidoreductase [Streptomyces coelicoflavus]|uniref:SDR family NAD(P)-dependent oxidoreductase n=1 Tax=Streptomyces coelicoflavus TaxID=285562 RepID=UPI003695D613
MNEQTLRSWLVSWLSRHLGVPEDDIAPDRPLSGLGLASRQIVELTGNLEDLLDRALTPALVYEAPTVHALARRLLAPGPAEETGPDTPVPPEGPTDGPRAEPIAVIGLGMRLPGAAANYNSFWELLDDGRDAIADPPRGRWDLLGTLDPAARAVLERTPARGGYLSEDLAAFDPAFFGMSDREAAATDPQQRLMLEVVWEALEHAGIPPRSLARSRTGVFVGASVSDYGAVQMSHLPGINAWSGAGSALGVIANRVSYVLGLRGPSLVVDTACSSSLVAVHQAVRSLRSGESDLALAGGVNLLLSPAVTVNFEEAGVMASDGRCKTFAADADGYGRGEGCGMVVLKPLSAARRDGDRVLAVIRGSAVNQDGASNGLLAPNPEAQEALLRTALAASGLSAADIDYVEAHGTGTALGDPIEASALGAVFLNGQSRDLLIGSVKTNIGHLEAAAGIAGLIKVVLALGHDTLPASLNFDRPNPLIPFDELRMRVVTERTPWPRTGRPRRAGVSSFGFGGTNAHVVVEEAPPEEPRRTTGRAGSGAVLLVPVSAGSADALDDRLRRLGDWLAREGADVPFEDVVHTLALRRSHEPERLTVPARDARDLQQALAAHRAGTAVPGLARGRAATAPPGPVWLFSGQGSQWTGMARTLLDTAPAFRRVIDELEPMIAAEAGFSLRRVLDEAEMPTEVATVQPLIFAVQLGLAELWRAHGLRPAAVIGHSMGEVAAAVVAGALDVRDGVKVICRRSRLLLKAAGQGAMAVIESPAEEVAARLDRTGRADTVTVAVMPSHRSTVIAGDPEDVRHVADAYEAEGINARLVQVDVASHSPQMDVLLDPLTAELADLTPRAPGIPFFSTVEGRLDRVPDCDAAYWCDNLRAPVRFADAVRTAFRAGHTAFVEISPHPLLTRDTAATLGDHDGVLVTGTLMKGQDAQESFLAAVGRLHCHGLAPDWERIAPDGHIADLPSMSWRRTRHWTAVPAVTASHLPVGAPAPSGAPQAAGLLGPVTTLADRPGTRLWQPRPTGPAWDPLRAHLLHGQEVMPLSGYACLALAAAREAGFGTPDVRDLTVHSPLVLDGTVRALQITLRTGEAPEDPADLDVHALDAAGNWQRHASARLHDDPGALLDQAPGPGVIGSGPGADGAAEPAAGADYTDTAGYYARLADAGLTYGPALRALRGIRGGPAEAVAEAGPDTVAGSVRDLDAAFQTLPAVLPPAAGWTVTGLDSLVQQPDSPAGPLTVRAAISGDPAGPALVAELDWYRAGARVARARGVRVRRTDARPAAVPPAWLHGLEWRPEPQPDGVTEGPVLVVGSGLLADSLTDRLTRLGVTCRTVSEPGAAELTDAGLRRHLGLDDGVRHVVHLPAPGTGPQSAFTLTLDAVRLVRAVAAAEGPRLWFVTVQTQAVGTGGPFDPGHAALWGIGRTAALEHPAAWGGLVDLEAPSGPDAAAASARALVAELAAAPGAGVQSAYRATGRHVPRLTARPHTTIRGRAARLDPHGAHLVVGATGRTGPALLARLAALGARHLVLLCRHGATGAAARTVERLRSTGTTVHEVAADVADEDALRALFARFGDDLPPLRGVFQAAFAEDVAPLRDLTPERVTAVLRPKVAGTALLHRLSAGHPVEHFLCFSSTTALLGSQGLAHYAAANCYMDALVHERRRTGTPAHVVNWGPWRDGLDPAVHDVVTATGMRLMPGEQAVAALDHVLAADATQFVVADADWPAVAAAYAVRTPVPVLAELGQDAGPVRHGPGMTGAARAEPPVEDDVAALLAGARTAEQRREIVVSHVRATVARALDLAGPQALGTDTDFHSYGLDSLTTMTILRRLKALAPGLNLAAISPHRTVTALADAVLRHREATAGD